MGIGIGHVETEAVTSHDGVDVTRDLSLGDDGISSLSDDGLRAW